MDICNKELTPSYSRVGIRHRLHHKRIKSWSRLPSSDARTQIKMQDTEKGITTLLSLAVSTRNMDTDSLYFMSLLVFLLKYS